MTIIAFFQIGVASRPPDVLRARIRFCPIFGNVWIMFALGVVPFGLGFVPRRSRFPEAVAGDQIKPFLAAGVSISRIVALCVSACVSMSHEGWVREVGGARFF